MKRKLREAPDLKIVVSNGLTSIFMNGMAIQGVKEATFRVSGDEERKGKPPSLTLELDVCHPQFSGPYPEG